MSQPWTPPPSQPAGASSPVPNNMVLAIIATIVSIIGCCVPHGVVSLIMALQVNKKAAAGDLEGAANSAKQAKLFAWISIALGVVCLILNIIFGGLAIISTALSH